MKLVGVDEDYWCGAVQWRLPVRRSDIRAAGFLLLPALPRSVGSRRWANGHDSVSMFVPQWPPLPLYGLHQGAESRAQLGRWTESVEINTNILPLDLTFIL